MQRNGFSIPQLSCDLCNIVLYPELEEPRQGTSKNTAWKVLMSWCTCYYSIHAIIIHGVPTSLVACSLLVGTLTNGCPSYYFPQGHEVISAIGAASNTSCPGCMITHHLETHGPIKLREGNSIKCYVDAHDQEIWTNVPGTGEKKGYGEYWHLSFFL